MPEYIMARLNRLASAGRKPKTKLEQRIEALRGK